MKARGMLGGAAVAAVLVAVLICGGAALAKSQQPDDSGPAPVVTDVEDAELAAALASFGQALRQRRR